MATVLVTAVLLAVAVLVLVANHSTLTHARHLAHLTDFEEHMERVRHFKCRHPRPRSFPVKHWFSVSTSERYEPEMTVLHRCEGSAGCCPADQVCAPVENTIEKVHLVFRVTNMLTHEQRYEIVSQSNHTKCQCRYPEDLPK